MRLWLMICLLWAWSSSVTVAEPRIALVIGNGAYRAVNALPNPPHDAALIADALKAAGFDVTLVQDGDLATMGAAVTEFGKKLREGGAEATGLFYYAGHGVQSFGQNYLVPVDAKLTNAADLSLVALDAQAVLRQMFSAHNRTNIVILDACRNNPFAQVRDLTDNGLAEMSAPTGTFLAYATAPGSVALDGAEGNSPFTKALAAKIATPGLEIEQAFKDVRVQVLADTGGKQTPWDTSSLTGSFTFVADNGASDEASLWANVSKSADPVQIMLFLRAYPQSPHEKDARALLAGAMQAEVKGASADTAARAVPDAPAADEVPADMAATIAGEAVSFAKLLTQGDAGIKGKTIEALVTAQPLFAPIEGLPKEAWANQPCATCHKWTKPALCDQAKFYVKEAAPSAKLAQHPLGGDFKLTLKAWGAAGCP